MPNAPGTKIKLPPKAPGYSKVTVPAAFDGPTRPGLRGAPVPPPQPPPQQAQRQDDITKADTPTSQSSRMRAIAAQQIDACQTCNRNRLSLWIGLGSGVVAAVGGIAVAVITVWSSHSKTAAEIDMDRKLSEKMVEQTKQLNRIHSRLDEMDQRWRETRDDLEQKIAARPLRRDLDMVTARSPVPTRASKRVARDPYGL